MRAFGRDLEDVELEDPSAAEFLFQFGDEAMQQDREGHPEVVATAGVLGVPRRSAHRVQASRSWSGESADRQRGPRPPRGLTTRALKTSL